MPFPIIESERQYRDLLDRIWALEQHLSNIDELQALARTHRSSNRIEDRDMRDLAPLEDARTDVAYTLQGLTHAVHEWEDLTFYGPP